MKKLMVLFFALLIMAPVCAYTKNDNTILKNKYFAITLPEKFEGVYEADVKKDRIAIYHKASKKAGFGGFVFGVKVYKKPSDHAVLPGSKKIGELTDKKGVIYDVVLKYPTDVQYDYTKSPEAPKSFKELYDFGEVVNIEGVKGSKYYKNRGMKGEDLYKGILEKHIKAINDKLDSAALENQDMSYMYNVISQEKGNVLDKIGYAYYDVNADGIEELLIGEIAQGDWKGIIYDLYTMVDRKPKHVMSAGARNRFFVCDDVFLCNEYSSGAGESGMTVYNLVENSTELYPQVSFKYDEYANKKNPWFISYGSGVNDDKWENMPYDEIKERQAVFEQYKRFDYKPLSTIKK